MCVKFIMRNPTVYCRLRNDKGPLERMEKKWVYRIPIRDLQLNWEAAYVGVTKRTIARRIEEHRRDIEQVRLTTSLAVEAYSKNISVKWDETEVVKPILRHTRPMIAESLEILRRSETEELVNDRLTWKPAQHGDMSWEEKGVVVCGRLWMSSAFYKVF